MHHLMNYILYEMVVIIVKKHMAVFISNLKFFQFKICSKLNFVQISNKFLQILIL
jgi:hypothetical protein